MNDNDRITTENFWQVWNSFQWPDPPVPVYRCYYHEDGTVDFYTMEDLPGRWVEVDRETYLACPANNARVVDGKLKIFPPKRIVRKLMPNQATGVKCDPNDVCVVVDRADDFIRWKDCDNEIH